MIETRHHHDARGISENSEAQAPSEWWLDRSVAQSLFKLLHQVSRPSDAWEREVDRLGDAHGHGVVCGELIFLLIRLRLEPADAQRYWPTVLAHRTKLAHLWGQPVDLRVALMSYFLDVERHFDRPTVVEMDWIEHAAASAYIDELTGLPNHRFFRDQLQRELDRSLRANTPVSLVLVDADDFKSVNDVFGHEVGNAVLASLGRFLRQCIPAGHVVARYGGEEFVLLLPSTPKTEAASIAEALRSAVASHRFSTKPGATPLALTMSLGLAACPADARQGVDLIVAADRALYEAKAAGKNQVCLYGASKRSFARRSLACPGIIRPVGRAESPIETVEIGEGGLSFRTECRLALGTLLEAAITLGCDDEVQLAGRVVWTRSVETGGYETAIQFIEPGHADRERIIRWLGTRSSA